MGSSASGQGKTSITAGLARYHRNRGLDVRVFKTGPDFLDPMILGRAAGHPVEPLDLWMVGEAECRRILFEAAGDADLILIEGVMGLYDGTPSSADLALRLGIPVSLILDGSAVAQSFAAVALGLATLEPAIRIQGVAGNRTAGQAHEALLAERLPEWLPWLGGIKRDEQMALPSRHLGLVQAAEVADLEHRLEFAADQVGQTDLIQMPPEVEYRLLHEVDVPRLLEGIHIAIARDAAFAFIYPANTRFLKQMGAKLSFFSPLADDPLPEDADAVWLPGGYPELYLAELAANACVQASLKAHISHNKPVYAECGGMLYLMESLTDVTGQSYQMAGLLPGQGVMQKRLAALGMQSMMVADGRLRGHTFHYSRLETPLEAVAYGDRQRGDTQGEALYQLDSVHATYFHAYFPSAPQAAAELFVKKV